MTKNPAASPLRFSPKQTIVFEGDSLTSRRMGPNREGWPAVLRSQVLALTSAKPRGHAEA